MAGLRLPQGYDLMFIVRLRLLQGHGYCTGTDQCIHVNA